MVACHIVLSQGERDGLHHEHLARDGEADARTRRLGGEEWNKHLLGNIGRDWVAIVAEIDALIPSNVNGCGVSFDGILGQIDKNLVQHVLVSLQIGIGRYLDVPLKLGIEWLDAFCEVLERNILDDRLLQLGELAVTVHKSGERLAGFVDSFYAFFVWSVFYLLAA